MAQQSHTPNTGLPLPLYDETVHYATLTPILTPQQMQSASHKVSHHTIAEPFICDSDGGATSQACLTTTLPGSGETALVCCRMSHNTPTAASLHYLVQEFMCTLRWSRWLKDLPHSGQNTVTPRCDRECCTCLLLLFRISPHSSHTNLLLPSILASTYTYTHTHAHTICCLTQQSTRTHHNTGNIFKVLQVLDVRTSPTRWVSRSSVTPPGQRRGTEENEM
ncbi:hypothetical protein E2C01_034188 [Portunus trituberculatus]|uniref:Uncharacterized protein n=1 Tax=Portunus trituberculatus TaxID=210409 RepID=A0A5B7F6E1_PORTR|nr:hypothetical protein [Portunus trituberculatus]